MDTKQKVLLMAHQYNDNWDQIYAAITKGEFTHMTDTEEQIVKKLESELEKDKIKFVTLTDQEYPEQLSHMAKPPFIIYIKGDFSLLKMIDKMVVITGCNSTVSDMGKRAAIKVALDACNNGYIPVVEYDGAIHRIVLQAVKAVKGKVVVILNQSLFDSYDRNIIDPVILNGGCVISTVTQKGTYPESEPDYTIPIRLASNKMIIVELQDTDVNNFLTRIGSPRVDKTYAVMHDISEAVIDGCNKAVEEGICYPYTNINKIFK